MKKSNLLLILACITLGIVQASDYPYAADPAELQIIYTSDRHSETHQLPRPVELRPLTKIFTDAKQLITALSCVTLDAKGAYFISPAFEELQNQSDDFTRIGIRYIQAINSLRSLLHNEDSVGKFVFLAETNEALTDANRQEVATIQENLMKPAASRSPEENQQIKKLIDWALPMLPPAGPAQPAAAAAAAQPVVAPVKQKLIKPKRKSADLEVAAGLAVASKEQAKSPRINPLKRSVKFNEETKVAHYTRSRKSYSAMHGETAPEKILYATDAEIHGGFSEKARIGTPTTSPLKGEDE